MELQFAEFKARFGAQLECVYTPTEALIVFCTDGCTESVKQLLEIFPQVDVRIKQDVAFRVACSNGRLETAQWLKSTYVQIDHRAVQDYAFRNACTSGHLEVAKWLINTWPEIDFRACNNNAFTLSCANNRLDVIEFLGDLYENPPKSTLVSWTVNKILVYVNKDYDCWQEFGLQQACVGGNINIVEYIVIRWPNIDYAWHNNSIFITACQCGHLAVVKLLVSTWPNINYAANKNRSFIQACDSNKPDMAKYLATLYDESNVHEILSICYYLLYDAIKKGPALIDYLPINIQNIIDHIIQYHGIESCLDLDQEYQKKFNDDVERIKSYGIRVKSARK